MYRFVVRKAGDTYTDKPAAEGVVGREREAIRQCRAAAKQAGLGAHGVVYGGERFTTLVYQCRITHSHDGAPAIVVDAL